MIVELGDKHYLPTPTGEKIKFSRLIDDSLIIYTEQNMWHVLVDEAKFYAYADENILGKNIFYCVPVEESLLERALIAGQK